MVKVRIIQNQEVESQMTTPPVPEQLMVVKLTTQKTQIRTKAQKTNPREMVLRLMMQKTSRRVKLPMKTVDQDPMMHQTQIRIKPMRKVTDL